MKPYEINTRRLVRIISNEEVRSKETFACVYAMDKINVSMHDITTIFENAIYATDWCFVNLTRNSEQHALDIVGGKLIITSTKGKHSLTLGKLLRGIYYFVNLYGKERYQPITPRSADRILQLTCFGKPDTKGGIQQL